MFTWYKYKLSEPDVFGLSGVTLTRLMLLSTYTDGDGGLVTNKFFKRYLNKKNIQQVLSLKDHTFNNCWSELKDKQIVSDTYDKFFLTQELFEKGNIGKRRISEMGKNGCYITRLYSNTVREIYNNAKTPAHAALSYIFRMIPFTNRRYNVLCYNPLEENWDNVQVMSWSDFCEQVGYNRSCAARLFQELNKIMLTTPDGKCHAIQRVDKHCIFVNPYIYYAQNENNRHEINKIFNTKEEN